MNVSLGQLDDCKLEKQIWRHREINRLTDSGNFSSRILCIAAEARSSDSGNRVRRVDFIMTREPSRLEYTSKFENKKRRPSTLEDLLLEHLNGRRLKGCQNFDSLQHNGNLLAFHL